MVICIGVMRNCTQQFHPTVLTGVKQINYIDYLTVCYASVSRAMVQLVLLTLDSFVSCSSSSSRRSLSRSASPSSFSPQRGRSGPFSAKRGPVGRGRGRGRGRRSQLSLGSDNVTSPEKKLPVGKRGGRKSLSSRLGAVARKKGYCTCRA